MIRYRKLQTALAAALKGETVNLNRLNHRDRLLIETVQALRLSNSILADRASEATQDMEAAELTIGALAEKVRAMALGEQLPTA